MLDHGMRNVLDQAGARFRAAMSRLAVASGLAVLAVLAALGGIGFLVAMLYLYLKQIMPTLGAGLLTGGLLLVLAAFLLFLASRNLRSPSRQVPPSPGPATGIDPKATGSDQPNPDELAARMGASIGADAVQWAKTHPFAGLAAALAAGFVVGSNPDVVRDLIKRGKQGE